MSHFEQIFTLSTCLVWFRTTHLCFLLFIVACGFLQWSQNLPVGCKIRLDILCLLAGYLNVLVNSQWKSRWCQIKDGHLHFYQDKNRSKLAQQPLSLAGCEVIPEPSPDHLYSFRILHNGEERVVLEVRCTSPYMFSFSLGVIAGLKPLPES